MPTTYTSGRFAGALTVVGAFIAGAVTITTLTVTTGNITTANVTTANVQTLSGATITARQANGIVRAVTISGSTITRSGIGVGVGQAACFKTGGVIGYCATTPTDGTCTCN